MSIGIYEKEQAEKQPVLVSITLEVENNINKPLEDISEVVSYELVVRDIQKLAEARHYVLAEKFAQDIATACLKYILVKSAKVEVVKTSIMPETSGVGVAIKRLR